MWQSFVGRVYRRWHLRPRDTSVEGQNTRLLYIEIFGAAIYNAIVTFNSVYALRLGASNQLIGLLSSVPSLVVALLTLPAGQLVERTKDRHTLVSRTVFIYRLGFLVIALMPFFIMENRALALVTIVIIMAAAQPFINVGFNTFFADLVPADRRSEVVSWRNIILGATITTVAFLAGRGLDALPFPYNYQVLYFIAFLGGLHSQYFWMKIKPPTDAPPPTTDGAPPPPAPQPTRLTLTALRRMFGDNPGLLRITVNTFVYGVGTWMTTPLLTIYYVRELGASNAWIGTLTGVINLATIVGYYLGRKIARRWGDRPTLGWTTILSGLYPGLVTLTPILDPILVLGGLYGIFAAGLGLSHFSTLLKVIPAHQRAMGLSYYNLFMFLGAFISPIISVALADIVGVRTMLMVGTLFWVAGGILYLVRPPEFSPLRPVEPTPQPIREEVKAKDGDEKGEGGDEGQPPPAENL